MQKRYEKKTQQVYKSGTIPQKALKCTWSCFDDGRAEKDTWLLIWWHHSWKSILQKPFNCHKIFKEKIFIKMVFIEMLQNTYISNSEPLFM